MKRSYSVAQTGLLVAVALTLSFLENLLPLGQLLPPGVKLGLSNIVTMFACFAVSLPSALIVVLGKAAFAFLWRGGVAGLLSLAGGALSALAAFLLLRLDRACRFGFFGVSIVSALCHNGGQLAAVYLLAPSKALLWYVPVLAVAAIIAGALTGLLLKAVTPYLLHLKPTINREEGLYARTALKSKARARRRSSRTP